MKATVSKSSYIFLYLGNAIMVSVIKLRQIRSQVFNTLGLLTPPRPLPPLLLNFVYVYAVWGRGLTYRSEDNCEVDSVLSPLQGCAIHTFICCVISPTPGFYKFRYCQSPNTENQQESAVSITEYGTKCKRCCMPILWFPFLELNTSLEFLMLRVLREGVR